MSGTTAQSVLLSDLGCISAPLEFKVGSHHVDAATATLVWYGDYPPLQVLKMWLKNDTFMSSWFDTAGFMAEKSRAGFPTRYSILFQEHLHGEVCVCYDA